MTLPPHHSIAHGGDRGKPSACHVTCSDGGTTPLERILIGLEHPRRRYLLYYLDERKHAHIAEAAQYIAACERTCDLNDIPAEHHENVKIDLFHVHLPKLADLELIEYDSRNGDIRFREPPDHLPKFIRLAAQTDSVEKPPLDSE